MKKKREVRTLVCQLSVREAAPDAESESRTIEGTAIVFNVESEFIDDWGQRFREVIAPEACTMDFLNTQDIKINLLHEREMSIARSNKGVGNATLSVDEVGVHFSFESPRCDLGDRALELIRAGVYSGCSFEFYPQDYTIEERDEEIIITHHRFRTLTALTIGMDPAYLQTAVNARELYAETPAGKEAARLAAQVEQEKMQREMQRRLDVMNKLEDITL